MNAPGIQRLQSRDATASAARRKADDLSLKLFNLTEIVKLASFAVEARRVLQGIKDAAACNPDMEKFIGNSSECPHTWTEMDDSTGNVLNHLARELGAVNISFTQAVYDLIDIKTGNADKNGGAA